MIGSQEARLKIPEEVAANGFEQLCLKAGDILVVPEALTQCVSPILESSSSSMFTRLANPSAAATNTVKHLRCLNMLCIIAVYCRGGHVIGNVEF
eukprot:COSAG02_NODE_6149_length_3767_cov_1.609051_2_plen_95_part_00